MADSLAGLEVSPLRAARRISDIGAGAGFPGLVLALAVPAAQVDLIESAGRKCAVIERLARAAGLENARAIHHRAEEWAGTPPPSGGQGAYDAATARALAELPVVAEYAAPLLREGGVLVAWKGDRQADEEQRAAHAAEQLGLASPAVRRVTPFRGAERRHLYVFEKVAPTPPCFPRRPGMAAKRPLGS